MPTRIDLVPGGDGSAPGPFPRRVSLNRALSIGAALLLWMAILVGLRLFVP
ncbi:hypothetical protein [uncultured Caulobacter sp.]|uniref:hypothetical protein n=1 Tax=uncultured Caulobacter sp. TaxID=158749 RepID=UPI00261801B4|nr:hypothetical protein [uncultured Caulobacter sp.]